MGARSPLFSLPTAFLVAALVTACAGDGPPLLRPAPRTGGPVVHYDLEAKPLPEIPLPNDAATRLDDSALTGRRLNVSELAPTEMERRIRRRANELDGFGVLSPITVGFEAPLDAEDIYRRQTGEPGPGGTFIWNRDPADDAVLLIRLGDGEACDTSPAARRMVPMDFGHGYYPLVLEEPCQYHYPERIGDYNCTPRSCVGDDPRYTSSNLIYETVDEDINGNGVLDPYEDTDYDGHLDKPNTWSGTDSGDAAADDLITFYEKETNTLVLWPVIPLIEGSRYAVVLTNNLKGADGKPIESPFPGVSPASQAETLGQLADLLPCYGMSLDDVAFAWTFTTGEPSRDLLAIREGLYGQGTLAAIEDIAPLEEMRPRLARDADSKGKLPAQPYVLPVDFLEPLLEPLASAVLFNEASSGSLADEIRNIEYIVLGEYPAPNFLVDDDGRATPAYPDDWDEVFRLDADTGEATYGKTMVQFICAIPQTTEEHKPPFPVALYGHGYSGAGFEILGFAGRFAAAGLALCVTEAPAHGLVIPEDETEILALLDWGLDLFGLRTFYDNFIGGRARDLDNDGNVGDRDNGADFWVGDATHTRDMLRQLIVEQMQFIRHLRAIDGVRLSDVDTDGDGKPNPVGDFNGDGVPDVGGWKDLDGDGKRSAGEPENRYVAWGQSMGGISSALLSAIDPAIEAAAPVSGSGALSHVAIRSTNLGVPEAVLMPILGPWITFWPHIDDETGQPDGRVDVGHLVHNTNWVGRYVFHVSEAIEPGDRIIVRNLVNGEERRAFATDELRFRVPYAADAVHLGIKRQVLGMVEDSDHEPRELTPEQAVALGDRLEVLVLDGWDGDVKERIDTVSETFTFQGATFTPGTPLVAIAEGMGHTRNGPDFRRMLGLSQTILEPADPAVFARHIQLDPLDFPYETGRVAERRNAGLLTSYLQYQTIGDPDVPMAAGQALARAAGLVDVDHIDPVYGETVGELLNDHHVLEGVERLLRYRQRKQPPEMCPPISDIQYICPPVRLGEEDRYAAFFDDETCDTDLGDCPGGCPDGEACFYDDLCVPCDIACAETPDEAIEGVHFDMDDLDDRTDRQTLPEYNLDPPLRLLTENEHGNFALRLPYMDRYGSHGVPPSIPQKAFDINNFVVNQLLWFFVSEDHEIRDDFCLVDGSCDFLTW